MALELVFECPRTLRSLRVGPLGNLLEGFCSWLLEHGFSRWTIRTHLSNVSRLNKHLASRRSGFRESLRSRDIAGFFNAYSLLCQRRRGLEGHVRRVRYSINRFIDYLREFGVLIPHRGRRSISPFWRPISSGCAITSTPQREHFGSGVIRHRGSLNGLALMLHRRACQNSVQIELRIFSLAMPRVWDVQHGAPCSRLCGLFCGFVCIMAILSSLWSILFPHCALTNWQRFHAD